MNRVVLKALPFQVLKDFVLVHFLPILKTSVFILAVVVDLPGHVAHLLLMDYKVLAFVRRERCVVFERGE